MEDLLMIENGALILPFINFPDYLVLKTVSTTTKEICHKGLKHVLFYGLTLPKEPSTIFYDIFHGDYQALEEKLIRNEDRKIVPNESYTIFPAMEMNHLWNNLTLLEIACMKSDTRAIQLLLKYNRSMAHIVHRCSSNYGQRSRILLKEYNEFKLFDKIQKYIIMRTYTFM